MKSLYSKDWYNKFACTTKEFRHPWQPTCSFTTNAPRRAATALPSCHWATVSARTIDVLDERSDHSNYFSFVAEFPESLNSLERRMLQRSNGCDSWRTCWGWLCSELPRTDDWQCCWSQQGQERGEGRRRQQLKSWRWKKKKKKKDNGGDNSGIYALQPYLASLPSFATGRAWTLMT